MKCTTTTFITQGGLGQGFHSRHKKQTLSSVLFWGNNKFWFSDQLLLLWLSETSKIDLYASKNLNFTYNSYVPFDLKRLMSLRVLQSFAVENEIYEFWRSFANPWHNYLQSALCLWWTRRSLHAAKAAFISMQI